MENNKLEKLKSVLELMQNDTVTPAKLAQFVTTIVKIIKDSKDSMESVSQETKDYLNKAISYLDIEHSKLIEKVNTESTSLDTKLTKKLDKSISDMKVMCEDLMMYKPKDGIDGLNGIDGKDGKDGSPDTAKEIKDKLETLKGEERLDSSAIKGLDTLEKGITNRAIEILDSRTKFLVNKSVKHDATLTGSGTDADPLKVVAGAGTGIVETVVAGTGISVDSTDPANPVVTNSAPDQTVSITAGTFIDSVTGTYPNFTINAAEQGGSYTLPTASDTVLGGIKVGDRLTITDGVLSADVQSGSGAVDSVNGQTGVVVLDADDIDDTSTTNKFVTATDITNLGNLSGTNTGDQDLSGLVPYTGATGDLDLGVHEVMTSSLHANSSAGVTIHNTSGQDVALFGAGGGQGVTFYDGVIMNAQTADRIALLGSTKNIISADTATYPNLTELSYVKGLTSAVQTQLNSKLNLDQTTPQNIVNGIPSIITDVSNFTSASHIVNKEYVDQSVSFIEDYYFNNTASSIGGIYYQMTDTQTGEAGSSFVSGTLTTGNDQALVNFATNAGIPGVITLRGGTYSAHIHADVDVTLGSKSANIYYKLYSRTTGGTETLLATSEVSPTLTTANSDYDLHANLVSDVSISNTDRIVIKWFVNVSGSGNDIVVTLYAEDDYASRLSIPTGTDILSSVYIRQDGTKPLTADWDAGSFEIRASTFESDVATGTAPFTIASTTAVTNLNADLLDGNHASAFATALGADDNYVTDAEKIVIGNTSGTNSGDVTVLDSDEIDFTLTGQQITASIKSGSIDETKLDTSTNASLDLADGSVQKSTYDAHTILYATTDNTPIALTVGSSTIVGRKATGDIVALTATETRTILNVADGATANTKATGAEIDTGTDDVKFATPKAIADSKLSYTDGTETLTNKRINPRLVTATSYTTDTGTSLDVSTCDQFEVTAQAGALKLNNPSGTPVGGQKLIVRIKDNGTARPLTYDTQYRAMGNALPTTTVVNKTVYMGFIYNATDTKWDLVALSQEV